MDGLFIINKPRNMTSHDVIFKIRKILQTKKVGHVGTLDPLATGVLPILIGKATKISKYLVEHNKEYEAILQLGEKRDTADSEGKCIERKNVHNNALEKDMVEKVLASMLGKQMQIPPMYSAIKVNGKKLYEYARNGLEIKVEPRQIEIFKLNLINIDNKSKTICINVSCSKGTYIRTLCEDIAEKLGTCRIYERT